MGGKNPSRKKEKGEGEGEKISVQRLGSQNSKKPYACRISTTIAPSRIEFMLAKKLAGGTRKSHS
jgi:hypothetical protein